MNTVRMILIGVLLVALSPGWAGAQSGHNLFQQALMQERTYGDLQEAIQLYQRIALEFTKDRALAARALVNLGRACEKLGVPGARDAYQQVLEEYPDQAEQARQARARLEAMRAPAAPERRVSSGLDPTYTLLFEEFTRGNVYDLSPDGRRLVMSTRGEGPTGIYISDPLTALPRLILPAGDQTVSLTTPRWSPDGTRIAVLHSRRSPEGGITGQFILIIDPEGNEISRIPLTTPGSFILAMAWTPDQQALTYARAGSIYSVGLDGQETDLMPEEVVDGRTWVGGYSPDGGWLAYSTISVNAAVSGFDVWVMPAAGGSARRLTQHQSLDVTPSWGPDGSLYFVSDRSGSRNIWRMGFDPRRVERIGEAEQVTFFGDTQIGPPSMAGEAGKMVYTLWRARGMVRVADASNPSASTTVARGERALDLSPDGSRVLYRVNPGTYSVAAAVNDGLFSVSSSGGAPVRLSPESHYRIWNARFSPDGSMVEYGATTADGLAEFQVSATGGEPERIRHIVLPSIPEGATAFCLSPDGSFGVATQGSGIYRLPHSGGEPTLLAELPGWGFQEGSIRFSPDGHFVSVLGFQGAPPEAEDFRRSDIFVVSLDGVEVRRITTDTERTEKDGLSWHPDGQRMAYSCQTEGGNRSTRMAYLDGRPTTLFHDEPGVRDHEGSWAPDGLTYFFIGFDEEGENTYRRNPDGTVDLICRRCMLPIVSADGRTYLYRAWEYSSELWMIEDFR